MSTTSVLNPTPKNGKEFIRILVILTRPVHEVTTQRSKLTQVGLGIAITSFFFLVEALPLLLPKDKPIFGLFFCSDGNFMGKPKMVWTTHPWSPGYQT